VKPLSADARTGTLRQQGGNSATYLQILLGAAELNDVVFPAEEQKLERERLIAEICSARCKGELGWKQ
jgi:hypothetical protein